MTHPRTLLATTAFLTIAAGLVALLARVVSV
jgi:hypothetical protein